MLVWATVFALILRVPTWSSVFLCVLTGASSLHYLVSYIYLMASDRKVLLTERYTALAGTESRQVAEGSSTALQLEQDVNELYRRDSKNME